MLSSNYISCSCHSHIYTNVQCIFWHLNILWALKADACFPLIFNAAQLCNGITQASTKLFSVFRVLSVSELRKEIIKRERVIDEHFGFGEAWWPTFWDSPLGLMRKQHPLAAHPVNSYCFSLPQKHKSWRQMLMKQRLDSLSHFEVNMKSKLKYALIHIPGVIIIDSSVQIKLLMH